MIRPSVTFDIEDPRPSPDLPARHGLMTHTVLDFLDETRTKATFFVVGELAESEPELVRAIAQRGHEVALHGWSHVTLDKLDPAEVREGLIRGKGVLEELAGQPCLGYRAPIFSLVPATNWVTELLLEAGFTYSSSVLPAANPQFGDPGAPRIPFLWANGLLELPTTVRGFGPTTIPFLGGFYLRVLPKWTVRRSLCRLELPAAPWVYMHPYDFDSEEKPYRLPWASWWVSRLVFTNRRRAFSRLRAVLELGTAAPLGIRVQAGDFQSARVFSRP